MPLAEYRRKRRFEDTPEPRGSTAPGKGAPIFVVQKHEASHLHYDFRLQFGDALWSWAVPKGPSTDPSDKRLAVHVEDHPVEYAKFHGRIPAGQYGAGTVEIWDKGTWEALEDARRGMSSGKLLFNLHGKRLRGTWTLVRMKPKAGERRDNWLLIKERDRTGGDAGVGPSKPRGKRKAAAAGADPVQRKESPQLATLVEAPPTGTGWLHEVKLDGYRILARLESGEARLFTRTGQDWTARFPGVSRAVAALPAASAWLDGEIVVFDESERPSFQALQQALNGDQPAPFHYFVFDLLHLDGHDLKGRPQLERKNALRELLGAGAKRSTHALNGSRRPKGPLQFNDHVEGEGGEVFAHACRLALEGIVSKRSDAPYRAGRGGAWVKSKCLQRQEFVIGGYTEPSGSRRGLGALLVGVRDPKAGFKFAGKVGTGFSAKDLVALRARLEALEQDSSPFDSGGPARGRGVHWVKPQLVGEVAFTEWTQDGLLRHPSFQGLREDKSPRGIGRERPRRATAATKRKPSAPEPGSRFAGVEITHPDRVLFAEQGVTKADLAAYYEAVATPFLEYAGSRPLSLVRCPKGPGGGCFFQKHLERSASESILAIRVKEKSGASVYPGVRDAAGLVALVQMGVLEIHPWGSTAADLEHPDRIIFDIDPDPSLGWKPVVAAAKLVREQLDLLGLESWPRTTGGKGIHVVAPLRPAMEWEGVKAFAHAFARRMERLGPEVFVSVASKERRRGRIFLDYLRNARGATAVASYSTRARKGAPVSMPVDWKELSALKDPAVFNVTTVPAILSKRRRDPWKEFWASRQRLSAAALRDVEK